MPRPILSPQELKLGRIRRGLASRGVEPFPLSLELVIALGAAVELADVDAVKAGLRYLAEQIVIYTERLDIAPDQSKESLLTRVQYVAVSELEEHLGERFTLIKSEVLG